MSRTGKTSVSLQWRHNGRDGVSNHQPHDWLVNNVYSTVYSGMDERKHQSSASLAFVQGIHWWPVNSPHKWPVKRKMFPFDDVIMIVMFNISKIRPKSLLGPAKAQTFSLCLWRWPNMEIYSQNDCFGLVYDISSVHQKIFSNHQTIPCEKETSDIWFQI